MIKASAAQSLRCRALAYRLCSTDWLGVGDVLGLIHLDGERTMLAQWRKWLTLLLVILTGCASIEPRAAVGIYGCPRTVRDELLRTVTGLTDKQQHCVVSARIVRQCSVGEAYLAGIGKELADLLGAGDAQWQDWQADRKGIRCAVASGEIPLLLACCAAP